MSAITQAEVQELAEIWYKKLDVHAPLEEFKPLLADSGVKMVFPEATVEGWDGFSGWYDRVIGIFFDEVHTLKEVTTTPKGDDKADVKVVVKWEASVWNPPAPTSERIVLDAYQTWEVKRSPETDKPVVLIYIVDELKYYEGSAQL
ncbi:MAG: hypothetical protein AAGE96_17455 [Cyanobacteria bacterium P01_G01_bin.19]